MSAPFEFARRSGTTVAHRHEAASLTLTLADLHTADNHTLAASFTTAVRLVDRHADLLLFDEQLLGRRDVVTIDDVRQLLLNPLKATLETFAAQHDAAACLRQQTTIETLLLQRCNAIGFGCGLDFSPPVELQLTSESLRASQINAQLVREQSEAIDRAMQLNARLKDLGPAHALPTAEQAALLPLIMQRAAATHGHVCVAAGDRLICFDPTTLALQTTNCPPEIGLLRCVRVINVGAGQRTIVGGQRGVWIAPTEDSPALAYTQPTALARGMNAIAWSAASRELVASHGEVGLIAWPIDKPKGSRIIATPPDPRWLTAVDERLVFASVNDLCIFDGNGIRVASKGTSRVVALLSFEHELWIAREDGTIETIDRGSLASTGTRRGPGGIQAAIPVTEAGLRAAVVSGMHGEVECIAANGSVLARFSQSLGPVRMLALAAGRIVGVSSDRSTLIVWDAANSAAEARSINILARTGHRIADVTAGTTA